MQTQQFHISKIENKHHSILNQAHITINMQPNTNFIIFYILGFVIENIPNNPMLYLLSLTKISLPFESNFTDVSYTCFMVNY